MKSRSPEHPRLTACTWMQEAMDVEFEPEEREKSLTTRPSVAVIDCKSAYDNVVSGAPAKDKRTAIDVVIVREALARCHGGRITS